MATNIDLQQDQGAAAMQPSPILPAGAVAPAA
jgi:hypothetical protein